MPIAEISSATKQMLVVQNKILTSLVSDLGLDNLALDKLGDEQLWQRAESAIVDLVDAMASSGELPAAVDQDQLIKETLNEALGLGPLEDLLADDSVEEIIADGVHRIMVTKSGVRSGASSGFSSELVFRRVVDRLLAPIGKKVTALEPVFHVRLLDGSLLSVILPPVASLGPCLTLRKPITGHADLRSLETQGALNAAMVEFLGTCLTSHRNILVCGAPDSGKSAVLAALATDAPADERVVSVEHARGLKISRSHWVALETSSGSASGIGMTELIRGAMLIRPDRLVVGEVGGPEAFELVQAMVAQFDGTLSSITGEGAIAALTRLATLTGLVSCGEAGARRAMVSEAVDVVIHVVRSGDGLIRVASIDEVQESGEGAFVVQNLFHFGEGNTFKSSGTIPSFYSELESRGIMVDASVF